LLILSNVGDIIMNENHQTQTVSHKVEHYEDEIALIDILRVIWKWKYLILIGTAVCALLAAIISFSMPKIYRINMALQPGIVSINKTGQKVHIDSSNNIKTIIETNLLHNEIMKYFQKSHSINLSNLPKFKVTIQKGSNIVKVSHETEHIDSGINILKALVEALQEIYEEIIKIYWDKYDKEIQSKKAEIAVLEAESTFSKQGLKREQERIKEIETIIAEMAKNNIILIREKNKAIQNKKNRDTNLLAFYNNTIQQNQTLFNQHRNDIKESLYRIEEGKIKNNNRRLKQDKLSADIILIMTTQNFERMFSIQEYIFLNYGTNFIYFIGEPSSYIVKL